MIDSHCHLDQKPLFELLNPESTIDVTLSEEFMMSPEGSVSALVFHHPQAVYFRIDEDDLIEFEKRL